MSLPDWVASLGITRRQLVVGGSLLLAITLLGSLCGWLLNRPTPSAQVAAVATATMPPTASSLPTSTPMPGPTFTPSPQPLLSNAWHTASLPPSVSEFNWGLSASLHDGNTAYLCTPEPNNADTQIFGTHDRGNHWAHLADMIPTLKCGIVVDDMDSNIAIIKLYNVPANNATLSARSPVYPHSGEPPEIADMITLDAGQHWRSLPAQAFFDQTASIGSTSYAIYHSGDFVPYLIVSHDHFATWQRIDQFLTSANTWTAQFWLNRSNGALLYSVNISGLFASLWSSNDGGVSWTKLDPLGSPAVSATGIPNFLIDTLAANWVNSAWSICGNNNIVASIICSTDSGKTWQIQPGAPPLRSIIGMTGQGEIMGSDENDSAYIYRLRRGATQPWQLLLSDGVGVQYADAPGDGVLYQVAYDAAAATATLNTLDYP